MFFWAGCIIGGIVVSVTSIYMTRREACIPHITEEEWTQLLFMHKCLHEASVEIILAKSGLAPLDNQAQKHMQRADEEAVRAAECLALLTLSALGNE